MLVEQVDLIQKNPALQTAQTQESSNSASSLPIALTTVATVSTVIPATTITASTSVAAVTKNGLDAERLEEADSVCGSNEPDDLASVSVSV